MAKRNLKNWGRKKGLTTMITVPNAVRMNVAFEDRTRKAGYVSVDYPFWHWGQ